MKAHTVSERAGSMQADSCTRCRGLMVPSFTDALALEIAEAAQSPSWRCVNCGEWLDETIMSNRLRTQHAKSIPGTPAQPSTHRRWRRYAFMTDQGDCDQNLGAGHTGAGERHDHDGPAYGRQECMVDRLGRR